MATNLQYQIEAGPETTPFIGAARCALDRMTRGVLDAIQGGHLIVSLPDGSELEFGRRRSELWAEWRIFDLRCFRRILTAGSLGLGESYVDGWWDVADDRLTDFIGILLRSDMEARVRERPMVALKLWLTRLLNSPYLRFSARRSVQRHYDLGNDFFKLMLDPTMAYSCGYQLKHGDSLEQMQLQKYALICNKLDLSGVGRLLDVGCGWGGLLIYAATRHPKLSAIGITLSREQYLEGNRRLAALGLSKRVQIKLCDYRTLKGGFDAVVSVGMFEHVGRASYPNFARCLADWLAPGGIGLLHTIGVIDPPSATPDSWMNAYIFPGSRLPRLDEICRVFRDQRLTIGHFENLQPHYAETLRKWKENFDRQRQAIRKLGPRYDERFLRMWNYYLQTSEACFRYGSTQVYQVLFSRDRGWRRKRVSGL